MLGAVCNTQTHRYLTHVWGDVTVGQGTSVVTAASSDCYSNFHKRSRNGPFLHNEQPPQHPQCPKPPLPGSQAQRGLLNWAGALGGKRHTQAASYLLPSSDRWHFLEGFLIPSPLGCGVTGRTKGCYLKLRRSGGEGGWCRRLWGREDESWQHSSDAIPEEACENGTYTWGASPLPH